MVDLSGDGGVIDMSEYIKPSDLVISMKFLRPEVMITNVVPRYDYVDGKKTEKVIGKYANGFLLCVTSVNPSTGEVMQKSINAPIKIKMNEKDDSLDVGSMRVCGTFTEKFIAKWYWNGKRYALSCYGERFASDEELRKGSDN